MKAAGLIQLGALAAVLFSMVAAIGVAVVYPLLRRRLDRCMAARVSSPCTWNRRLWPTPTSWVR